MKTCRTCGILLSSSIAAKNRRVCKYCLKAEKTQWRQRNKDKVNEARKLVRRKPKQTKRCVVCGKDFETAKECDLTCGKDCSKIYTDFMKRKFFKSNTVNKEKKNTRSKAYYHRNKEVINEKRRLKRRGI